MSVEIEIIPKRKLFPKDGAKVDDDSTFYIYGCDVLDEYQDKVKMNRYGNISMKGNMDELNIGETYKVVVSEERDSNYAGSYNLKEFVYERAVTPEQQRNFLSSILTFNQVNNIFEKYSNGEDIITMIEEDTFEYSDIKGIGEKTYESIKKKVMKDLASIEVLAFLTPHGMTYPMIKKLEKEYGDQLQVIRKIKKNPYILTEVNGIGFVKADEVAMSIGYDKESPHRINSCLYYIIKEENNSGNSWLSKRQLTGRAVDLLNIGRKVISNTIDEGDDLIVSEGDKYTVKEVYDAEQYIAKRIKEMINVDSRMFTEDEINDFLNKYEINNNVEIEKSQRQFFHDWNSANVSFLIGSGGMGKSWLQNILLEMVKEKDKFLTVGLYAPTGRASKKMAEYTGRTAGTIHRRIVPMYGEEPVIMDDIIVIDETSMCDVFIVEKLLRYIKNDKCKIVFVGDDFQLPSVGVGNFLYDCINSGTVVISKLQKVFRQKDGGILDVATDVREGKVFLNNHDEGKIMFGKDCLFHLSESKYVIDGLKHYYKRLIKKHDASDIIILSPTRKGKLGTVHINKVIQSIINPHSPNKKERTYGKKDPITFRVGDVVMNTVNTYDTETEAGGVADIFNGDMGVITDIKKEGNKDFFVIDFEGVTVLLGVSEMFERIIHSWAMTIHKSQGSQFKVVINIMDSSAKFQLNANLIYTAFSRPEEFMIVLGQADAVNYGMAKKENMDRRSFLGEMLVS